MFFSLVSVSCILYAIAFPTSTSVVLFNGFQLCTRCGG